MVGGAWGRDEAVVEELRRAKEIFRDVEAELARASGPAASTSTTAGAQTGYRIPVNRSLDGNTVELSVEQTEFSENTLRYQTSLSFINRRIAGLMTAIKGE